MDECWWKQLHYPSDTNLTCRYIIHSVALFSQRREGIKWSHVILLIFLSAHIWRTMIPNSFCMQCGPLILDNWLSFCTYCRPRLPGITIHSLCMHCIPKRTNMHNDWTLPIPLHISQICDVKLLIYLSACIVDLILDAPSVYTAHLHMLEIIHLSAHRGAYDTKQLTITLGALGTYDARCYISLRMHCVPIMTHIIYISAPITHL